MDGKHDDIPESYFLNAGNIDEVVLEWLPNKKGGSYGRQNIYFADHISDPNLFDEEVDMVEMRTTEGEIGVLAGHIPLTAIVEPGVVKIHQEGKVREAALLDGFVEIRGNKVTVLAEACEYGMRSMCTEQKRQSSAQNVVSEAVRSR